MSLLNSWGLAVVPIGAGTVAMEPGKYPNRRSELWFRTAERARGGGLDLHRLPRDVRERLKVQLMAPVWTPDTKGRRVVEKKEKTKEKIHRSPDDADAMNLAYYDSLAVDVRPIEEKPRQRPEQSSDWRTPSHAEARGLLGRGAGLPQHHYHRGFLGR
jgi:hypothetical protein